MLKVWVLSLPHVCDTDRLRDSSAAESEIFLVSITSSKLERGRVGWGHSWWQLHHHLLSP